MLRAIKFVSVPVADQDRSLAFFTEKLGFRIVTDQPFDDRQRWIELALPGQQTGLVLFTMEGDEDRIGAMSNIVFLSDDVSATYAELSERGVEFEAEPVAADWGTSAILRDPDGNRFVISSK